MKKTIVSHKTAIITATLLLILAGLITVGTLRLILRHNYDLFNLLPIIGKSLMAMFALLALVFLFYLKKLISQKIISIGKNLETEKIPKISETAWFLLNVIVIYFFLSMTTKGDFHFIIPNEAEMIVWSMISSMAINLIPAIPTWITEIRNEAKKKKIN